MSSGILIFLTSETSIFVILVEVDPLQLRDFSPFLWTFQHHAYYYLFQHSETRKTMEFQKPEASKIARASLSGILNRCLDRARASLQNFNSVAIFNIISYYALFLFSSWQNHSRLAVDRRARWSMFPATPKPEPLLIDR